MHIQPLYPCSVLVFALRPRWLGSHWPHDCVCTINNRYCKIKEVFLVNLFSFYSQLIQLHLWFTADLSDTANRRPASFSVADFWKHNCMSRNHIMLHTAFIWEKLHNRLINICLVTVYMKHGHTQGCPGLKENNNNHVCPNISNDNPISFQT